MPTQLLERHVFILKAVRKRIADGEVPTGEPALAQVMLKTLLDLSTEDVLHPGKNVTLLEAMGLRSVEHIDRKAAGKVA